MVKFISYNEKIQESKEIEIFESNSDALYYIRASRLGDKIVVESVSDEYGHITTYEDMIRHTGYDSLYIRSQILEAFSNKR